MELVHIAALVSVYCINGTGLCPLHKFWRQAFPDCKSIVSVSDIRAQCKDSRVSSPGNELALLQLSRWYCSSFITMSCIISDLGLLTNCFWVLVRLTDHYKFSIWSMGARRGVQVWDNIILHNNSKSTQFYLQLQISYPDQYFDIGQSKRCEKDLTLKCRHNFPCTQ